MRVSKATQQARRDEFTWRYLPVTAEKIEEDYVPPLMQQPSIFDKAGGPAKKDIPAEVIPRHDTLKTEPCNPCEFLSEKI